ncbi:MAG: translocation/assembly module TamB domain-containing protein [Vicinamibacterales bacterium]
MSEAGSPSDPTPEVDATAAPPADAPPPPGDGADGSGLPPAGPGRPKGRKRRFVWRWSRRSMTLLTAVVAGLLVSFLSLDLGRIQVRGQSLTSLAEKAGSNFLKRPLHIGSIQARMWPGRYELRDVVIEGLHPGDAPFLRAGSILVDLDWSALVRRDVRVRVEMTDWRMSVERWADGSHNVPRLKPDGGSGGKRPFTTTVDVSATGGEFRYADHGTPWSVTAPNLIFGLARTEVGGGGYVGTARFHGGVVQIQQFEPMATAMTTRFTLEGGLVKLDHIDLTTDGSTSHINGVVDFGRWPEQHYNVNSTVDFARMHEIFFKDATWDVAGTGGFRGVFELFKAGGHNLEGDFTSDVATLDAGGARYRFPGLHGSLQWEPHRFVVPHAEADLSGGHTTFTYGLEPLGTPGGATASFTADYRAVDLERLTSRYDLDGLRLAGAADGRIEMRWPNGRFSAGMVGGGTTRVTPPAGAVLAPLTLPSSSGRPAPPAGDAATGVVVPAAAAAKAAFDPYAPLGALPVGGALTYRFDRGTLVVDDSWAATASTHVRFQGHTDYGTDTELPFRVASLDWQESDRVLAGMLRAFGRRTGAVEVGGRGTFDGVMTRSFTSPRIAGRFTAEDMRAWDVTWGRAAGDIVIQNSYVDVTDGVIGDPDGARILANGRFSLGFPRDDEGEEINARVVVTDWPLAQFRHAFGLDAWPMEGRVGSADLELRGAYTGPFGTGTLRIDDGRAWGESFARATARLQFEGTGLQVNGIELAKGTGTVRGAAWIGWNNRYSFDADGERIPVESLDSFRFEQAPFNGQLEFKASGAGDFDAPAYQFDGSIPDLGVGDEGIGPVTGHLEVADGRLVLSTRVASIRGTVDGAGTIGLGDDSPANLNFRFFEASIDPYLKFVAPEVSPYTRLIASGLLHIEGPLSDTTRLRVDATVDTASITLLDYELANDGPVRLRFADDAFAIDRLALRGEATTLELSGGVDAGRRTVNIAANGQANLAVLQLFYSDLRGTGAARVDGRLQGTFDRMALFGDATIVDGSVRHLGLPHSLTAINGPIRFDAAGIDVSALRGQMGGGNVVFGGRITLRDGYRPDEFDVTARGQLMRLRYPEGFTSTANADLWLRGPVQAPTLGGTVDVLDVNYHPPIESTSLFELAGGAVAGGADAAPAEAPPDVFPLGFNVHVQVARTSLLQTAVASIQGSASLDLTGTLEQPSLNGRVDIDSGEFYALGNRYLVQPGTVDFTEALPFQPVFDLQAETRVRAASTGRFAETFTITVRVTGTFDQLTPTLQSTPYLPQTDIVTLIFGGVPDIGTIEQRQLSPAESQQAMVQTAGAVLLTSPISARVESVLRSSLGIDAAQVTPQLFDERSLQQLNPSVRVAFGKRISDDLYLTYSRTLQANEEEIIQLEYTQNDRVSWILSRNENRTFSLDFRIRYVIR